MNTITALATPPGIGGIAVIRVSGDEAINIVDKCFRGRKRIDVSETHTVLYGKIYNKNILIDTVLVSVFRKPNSYTGEDVIEISCHGGMLVANEIIDVLLKNDARLAEPGEFTKRAFLNGKMDLTQVEAVADIIHSVSVPGTQTSARQLDGEFTNRLKDFRKQLVEIAGLLELELDFADEDIELIDREDIAKKIEKAYKYCIELAESYKSAEILRSGYFVGIAGYPNAGKSRLFNTLLQRNRAIVSETPGTTRDYLEENLMLGGITVRLIDTAGLRDTEDTIEIEGIRLMESVLRQSNMILVINDISIDKENSAKLFSELERKYDDTQVILLQNKIDLLKKLERKKDRIYISAKTAEGIEDLKVFIEKEAKSSIDRVNDILINQRQAKLLNKAGEYLSNANDAVNSGKENELIAIDIRNAAKTLGEITGESWSEKVLNAVFDGFCIGK
jgi:tRNA modification GTPase